MSYNVQEKENVSMKNYIDSSDVKKRMRILKEQEDCSQITSTKTCYNLYETANRTKSVPDIVAFFKECGQGAYNADAYLDKCIQLLESATDPRVSTGFQDFVLPIVSRSALAEAYSSQFSDYSEDTRKLLQAQYDYDLAMEQVAYFHDALGDKLLYDASNTRLMNKTLIYECCNGINENFGTLSATTKAIASVNEAFYILQESGRTYKSLDVIMEVLDYYYGSFKDNDFLQFVNGLERDPFCKEYYKEGFNVPNTSDLKANIDREFDKSSAIVKACRAFDHLNVNGKNVDALKKLKAEVFASSTEDIQNNFNKFLDSLFNTCLGCDAKVSKYICDEMLPEVEEEIKNISIDNYDVCKEFTCKIIAHIKEALHLADEYINMKNNVAVTENIIYLRIKLEAMDKNLAQTFDYVYPSYAVECAFGEMISEKNSDTKNTKDFKLFKFDNVITRCYKIDRFLVNQFNQFKDKFKKKLDKVNEKIFGEATIYEMLTDDGNLDYCVTSFDVSDLGSFEKYHEFCTNCIRYINTEILGETGMICYYQVNPDTLEFRIKENLNLELTDEDKTLIEQNLSLEDLNRIDMLLEAAEVYPDFNFITESIEFFKRNPEPEYFNTYLEAASMAGVPIDTMEEIYESIKECNGASFVVGTSYNVSQYKPMDCDLDTVFESVNALELILEADKPMTDRQKAAQARREAQLAKWEKEEEEKENGKSANAPKKPEQKKVEPKKEKKPISNNSKVNNAVEKAGEGIDKLKRFMNNMKIYVHAIRGAIKKADAKTQSAMRNMDSTVERLGRGIKSALVSDRREAIIKGSVIPSFHKCLLIAAAEAGLWALNPPLAIIAAVGGLAASKKLTKKERALLYDDIMIELKILEKEVQRAEDRNQTKKLRQLLRMQRELERQATRIQYNIRFGKDRIPGGTYINRDND